MAHPPEAAATADLPSVETSPAAGGPTSPAAKANARLELSRESNRWMLAHILPRLPPCVQGRTREGRTCLAEVRKEAEEKVAPKRSASRTLRRQTLVAVDETIEEEVEAWQLFFTIALGIFLAFATALDLDVLRGIIFMPIIRLMEWLAPTTSS